MKARRGWFVLPISLTTLLLVAALSGNTQAPSRQQQDLTKRVDQIYRLFVIGDWKKVEPMVSEDTRNNWAAQAKGAIDSFQITEVKLEPDGKHANASVLVTFRIPQVGGPITQAQKSKWVYEKGNWFIQIQPPPSPLEAFRGAGIPLAGTPSAGTPSVPTTPISPVVWDQNPIRLPRPQAGAETVIKVSFQNVTPNPVLIQNLRSDCPCLKVATDKTQVQPVEKGVLTLTYNASLHPNPQGPLHVQGTLLAPAVYFLDLPVNITGE